MGFAQRTSGKLDGIFANAGVANFGPAEGVAGSGKHHYQRNNAE